MPQICHLSVLPVLTVFLQWTSNGYVTPSTLYKGTPWLISVAFDKKIVYGVKLAVPEMEKEHS